MRSRISVEIKNNIMAPEKPNKLEAIFKPLMRASWVISKYPKMEIRTISPLTENCLTTKVNTPKNNTTMLNALVNVLNLPISAENNQKAIHKGMP
jgi:hypothetical protein